MGPISEPKARFCLDLGGSFLLDHWLAGWLVGWLVGWLAGWVAGRLVGWLVGWVAGRQQSQANRVREATHVIINFFTGFLDLQRKETPILG